MRINQEYRRKIAGIGLRCTLLGQLVFHVAKGLVEAQVMKEVDFDLACPIRSSSNLRSVDGKS